MEAGLQYRSRTLSSPHFDYYHYTPCARSKTSDADMPPITIARLRFPLRPDGSAYRYEPPVPNPPPPRKRMSQNAPCAAFVGKPVHKASIEAWIDEQIHLSDRSNYGPVGRAPSQAPSTAKEELRQRMRDELVYEYEAEAHKWMSHEAEMRRRAQAQAREREREEARRRVVQEDIVRIQARVRERRDSERRVIAEERRNSVERAKEKVRRDHLRAERAVLDAWQAYEARWADVSASSPSSSESLGFDDIPWPVLEAPGRVADLTPEHISRFLLHPAHSSNQSRRERIRMALLRWHPDRFRRILNRVAESEKGAVEEGVGVIARCLNELLAKEGKALQQGR